MYKACSTQLTAQLLKQKKALRKLKRWHLLPRVTTQLLVSFVSLCSQTCWITKALSNLQRLRDSSQLAPFVSQIQ